MDTLKVVALSHPWLRYEFLGNTTRAYLYSLAFILGGWAITAVVDRTVLRRMTQAAERTRSGFDDFLVLSLKKFGVPSVYVAILYLGVRDLAMREAVAKALQLGAYAWVAVNAVRFLSGLIQALLERHMESRAGSPAIAEQEKKSVRGILVFVNIVLWALAFILVLDNLGLKVTTFMAGLGIGGIAIALAAQAILGDLFSYFVIFFDRPFQAGHTIKVGNFIGEVESIGIKTTRLRSITGETIVMSNKHLTDNQIQNFRLMQRRRMMATFEVTYDTPDALLREIPAVVRGILDSLDKAAYDRCHLKEFADSGLRFELVYFVEAPEMLVAMDIQQELNLRLKEELEKRGIDFAFPTRVLHMAPPAPAQATAKEYGEGMTTEKSPVG